MSQSTFSEKSEDRGRARARPLTCWWPRAQGGIGGCTGPGRAGISRSWTASPPLLGASLGKPGEPRAGQVGSAGGETTLSCQARARGPSAEPAPLRRGPLPGRFGRRALPQALLSLPSGNPLLPAWQSPCRWLSTELGAELCQEAASRPSYPVRLLHRGVCQAAPPLGYRRLAGIGLPASSGKERPWNARSLKHFAQSPALSFHN